jgi:hypothetical protein
MCNINDNVSMSYVNGYIITLVYKGRAREPANMPLMSNLYTFINRLIYALFIN